MDHEYSAAYVDAMLRAFKASPKYGAFTAKVPANAMDILNNPYKDAWHKARLLDGVWAAAIGVLGEAALEEASYVSLKDRYGPLVMPLFKKAIASKSPAAVLKEMGEMTSFALKGVVMRFEPRGEKQGLFKVGYPRPVAPQTALSWRGVLRFVFEVTVPGKVTKASLEGDGRVVVLEVDWA